MIDFFLSAAMIRGLETTLPRLSEIACLFSFRLATSDAAMTVGAMRFACGISSHQFYVRSAVGRKDSWREQGTSNPNPKSCPDTKWSIEKIRRSAAEGVGSASVG